MPLTPADQAALTDALRARTAAEAAARRAAALLSETVAAVYARGGVTETELAAALGVSQQRVSQLLDGGRANASRRLH
ncbi:hypothetical protein [Actinotalea sp. JY-7885]|uniref:hypothetical protein n=1 Tax=Actinotalea sp. JY-7885 TaxID=2758576 RepID=UPI00165D67DA|nr:hypothetical protein [Actinotalea sp. JY-7885]